MLPVIDDVLDDNAILMNRALRSEGGFDDVGKYIFSVFGNFLLPKEGNSFCSSPANAVIAFLSYICNGVTYAEIRYFFGKKGMNRSVVGRHLASMVGNKELNKINMSFNELGGSKTAYCLTKKGYEKYLSDIPDFMVRKRFVPVSKNEDFSLHSYGAGLSLLSLLIAGGRFEFDYEVSSASSKSKAKDTVTSDIALLYDDNKRVFVEQDAGTEKTYVLYRKLGKYLSSDRSLAQSDTLIISSYDRVDIGYAGAFSAAALDRIMSLMMIHSCDDVFEMYDKHREDIGKVDDIACLQDFLLLTGTCKKVGRELVLSHPDSSCSLKELVLFVKALKIQDNPYLIRVMEKAQMYQAKRKFKNLVKYTLDVWSDNQEITKSVSYCMNGTRCYVLPSMLINCYKDELFNVEMGSELEKAFRNIIAKSYGSLSGGAKFKSYTEKGDHVERYMNFPDIHFRNAYLFKNGKKVFFENISEDVSGFVRVRICAAMARKRPADLNVNVICMYTDREDVEFLLSFFVEDELKDILSFDKDGSSFHLYFVRRNNLNSKGYLEEAEYKNKTLTLKKIKNA